MDATNWEGVRQHRFTKERPEGWPGGVFGISLKGLNLLGVHEKSGSLYWDGKEIKTYRSIRLGTFERWVAVIAAVGTFGTFVVNLARFLTGA
jgi:hypothetical protein